MKKIKLTVAQALVKFLDQQYVKVKNQEQKFVAGVLAIFGHGNVVGLGEALSHEHHQLHVMQAYNEQSMGHIAMGFAKQNKNHKIYAVTSSVGPGATNMVTAAAAATANRIPVLFLPGDVYASRQPDPVLQQITHPHDLTISANDAFKSVAVYWDRISRPEQLMSAMLRAMLALTNVAHQGAVVIALPQDVQGEAFEFPVTFFQKRVYSLEGPDVKANEIQDIMAAINRAQWPLIICGGGVKYAGAEEALDKFATHYGVPVAMTQAGKSSLVYDHAWNLGGIGTTGFLSANQYARQADLVIGLGTRYTDFTTASKSLFAQTTKFINVNASRWDAGKMDGMMVVADIKQVLQQLNANVLPHKNRAVRKLVTMLKQKARQEIKRLFNLEVDDLTQFMPEINDHEARRQMLAFFQATQSQFTQTQALGVINQHIKPDAIIVGASGSLPGDLQRIWQPRGINTYHVEYGYSCMGYEVGGALGVKLAQPRQEVYAIVGDGAYLMLHTALITAIQEKQKINVMLFNNAQFGCINNLQVEKGIHSLGTEFITSNKGAKHVGSKIMYVDYAQQAAGYGAKTYKVKNKQALIKAIEDAQHQSTSTLIEIIVLPKTMTHGYDAWWRVGNAQVSTNKKVLVATAKDTKIINQLKGY